MANQGRKMTDKYMVQFTLDQTKKMQPLFEVVAQKNRENIPAGIIAQVYPDGVVAKVITGDMVAAVQCATGTKDKGHFFARDHMKESE
jgi:hypothetical protein